jgi:hypothetical protein
MTTYIKNKGITQTFFQDNHHHKKSSQIKWDANYNGKHANINVDVQNNGKKNKYRMQLNNKDLAKLLSIPSVNQPLEQRLHNDFLSDFDDDYEYEYEPEEFQIEQPQPILFRINIPEQHVSESESESEENSPFSINELSSLSTPESLLSEITNSSKGAQDSKCSHDSPVSSIIPELVRLTKRQRNARLKTPSPKTMRIHYTTQSLGRGLRKKRQQSIKTNQKTRKNKTMNRTMNKTMNRRNNKMKSALTNFFKDRF